MFESNSSSTNSIGEDNTHHEESEARRFQDNNADGGRATPLLVVIHGNQLPTGIISYQYLENWVLFSVNN